MRMTDGQLTKINSFLAKQLKKKRFEVHQNKQDIITDVKKFGIHCCPSVVNSTEDGRHGYAYLSNVTGYASENDLGYYYKPSHSKSKYRIFKNNDSIDKYDINNKVVVTEQNYERVIKEFITDLNKDYLRIVKTGGLEESMNKVKIKNTGIAAFDGKTGIIESEDGDKCTVMFDFDDKGHKVRNTFNKENLEVIEHEDLKEAEGDDNDKTQETSLVSADIESELEEMDLSDKVMALYDYLYNDEGAENVVIDEDTNENSSSVFERCQFTCVVDDEDRTYLVCTDEEATHIAEEDAQSLLDDLGPYGVFGESCTDYMDEDVCAEWLHEDSERRVNELDDDELLDECISYSIISFPDDFTLKDDVDPDDEDFDEDDRDNYECDVDFDSLRDSLAEKYDEGYYSPSDYVLEIYGEDEKSIRDLYEKYPNIFNERDMIETLSSDRGSRISSYDGREDWVDARDGHDDYYIYRVD